MTSRHLLVLSAACLTAAPLAAAAAQHESVIRVRVVDSSGTPVSGADVSALRGLSVVVRGGPTDAAGMRTITLPTGGHYEVVARRIGYYRGGQFFTAYRDTMAVQLVLHTATQTLPTVSITAQEDVVRRAHHIEADDIANSTRPIFDGLDILTKLRPDMIYSRVPGCALRYVWVNGRRIVFPPIDQNLAIRQWERWQVSRATPHIGPTGLATVNLTVQSVMASIHPEHIESMTFADCNDTTVKVARGNSALYVALKPGVMFQPGVGSFVLDAPPAPASVMNAIAGGADAGDHPALYRNRLLGLFDDETGEPIAGAEVADSTSGTFALTTATGTVSLVFLPDGLSTLRIRKPGYPDLFTPIVISPRDTAPITLTLSKSK